MAHRLFRFYGDETSVVRSTAATGRTRRWTVERSSASTRRWSTSASPGTIVRQVLHDYFAWATMTTMSRYHGSADDVPEGLHIPHWSWDGLVGE